MSLSFSPTPDSAPKGNLSWLPTREDTVLILESSGEAMFVTDRDGRILSLNPVAQQLMGRYQDVIGSVFHELVGCLSSNEGRQRGCPLEHTVRTGEVTMVSPLPWTRADGTGSEIAVTFWPRCQGLECVGALVVCRDLTVEREAERDIQRVARLAEDAPNPIVEFDETGIMLYANTAMVELLSRGTSIQGRVEAVFPPSLPDVLKHCLDSKQPTGLVLLPVGRFEAGQSLWNRYYGRCGIASCERSSRRVVPCESNLPGHDESRIADSDERRVGMHATASGYRSHRSATAITGNHASVG